MTIDKALDRFKWRITSRQQFVPNKGDVEAYNTLVEYVENARKQVFRSSELYARLYVWAFRQFLQYYNSPVTNPLPQRELHKVIDKPAAQHVQEFTDFLNDQEMYSAFDVCGSESWMHLHDSHLREVLSKDGRSEEEIERRMENLRKKREAFNGTFQEFLKENPKIEAMMYKGQKVWEFEWVAEHLRAMIVKSIEAYHYRGEN